MKDKLEAFISEIPNFEKQTAAKLIDYFIYYLIAVEHFNEVRPRDIEECFAIVRVKKYSNIPRYLSESSKQKRGGKSTLIKTKDGYQLERTYQLDLQKTLISGPAKIETTRLLKNLPMELTNEKELDFLREVIDCYEIGCRRAAIVMVWILTMYHLYEYIFQKEIISFNSALQKNTDKRIKISKITKIDEFSEIPEEKFIELARAANIISKDVRKILDTKLGIRNSSAHPSAIKISEVKATDFIIDLVDNVILKYVL